MSKTICQSPTGISPFRGVHLMPLALLFSLQLPARPSVALAAEIPFRVTAHKAADVGPCKLPSDEIARRIDCARSTSRPTEFSSRVVLEGPPPTYELLFARGERDFIRNVTMVSPCHTFVALSPKPGDPKILYAVKSTSLSRQVLLYAISPSIDHKSISHRLMIVSLFVQMSRYEDAREELKTIEADFPDRTFDEERAQLERLQRKAR